MRRALLAFAFLLTSAVSASAQTVGSGGGSQISAWGKPNTQTYGQTVTAVNSSFDSFSFWLQGGSDLLFRAYIFAWDQTLLRATGSALFTSVAMAAPGGTGFQQVFIGTGGVSVLTGNMYVAFLSTSGQAGSGSIPWESTGGDGYTGGAFVFINNGDDLSAWTNSAWSTNWQGPGSDLRFQASFSDGLAVVPEPGSMLLMATGLAGLAAAGLRRRRTSA